MDSELLKLRIPSYIYRVAQLLEIVVSLIVIVAITLSVWSVLLELNIMTSGPGNTDLLQTFLADVFTVVIGIEFLKMLYSDKCVEDQLKAGNLPATTNASEMVEKVVDNASDEAFLEWESQALTDAPHFMITWTPNHVSSSSQPMLDGMQQYFNGSIDMDTFIDEMKALPTE